MDVKIIFEDNDVIVCDKPSGILSEGEGKESMIAFLSATRDKVFCVHRLDRETSGLMVFAKNAKSAASLSEQIRGSDFEKEYLALIEGAPENDSGIFEDMLFFDRTKNKSFIVKEGKKERKGVKHASLEYSVVSKEANTSLVRVNLHTGRTHQIRIQFASRGMPLVADRRYGAKPSDQKSFSLRCCRISFYHPKTKEKLCFEI